MEDPKNAAQENVPKPDEQDSNRELSKEELEGLAGGTGGGGNGPVGPHH